MANNIYRVDKGAEYRKAGPTDLIQLRPAPGSNPLFLTKWLVETLVYGIVRHELIHLSGPTGTAKSSLIEALFLVPENFGPICHALGFPVKPLRLYPIEMATYETPGELYQRRALQNGSTFDEKSQLVEALIEAAASDGEAYPLIWLREMGRVPSASVQGGLLDLMTRSDIILPGGERIDGRNIAWVADSNYQADSDATHTLVTFDDALKRRFTINLTLDYLPAEQEAQVLQQLAMQEMGAKKIGDDLIAKIVKLGQAIRRHRSEGKLMSCPPPTIYGYLAFLRMAIEMPHLHLQQLALATLLGNADVEDQKQIPGVLHEVFGLRVVDEDDPAMGGNLF